MSNHSDHHPTHMLIMMLENDSSLTPAIRDLTERILEKQRQECDLEETARLVTARTVGARVSEMMEAFIYEADPTLAESELFD